MATWLQNPRRAPSPDLSAAGILLRWYPSSRLPRPATEVQIAPDDGTGSPDESRAETVAIVQPGVDEYLYSAARDGRVRHFRIRHTLTDWTPSAWLGWVSAAPVHLESALAYPLDPTSVSSGTKVLPPLGTSTKLLPTNPVLAEDSGSNTLLEDGDAVVFSGFTNPPRSWALLQGGMVWEETLATSTNTNLDLRLANVTTSGADVVAKLQQPGAATNYDDNFAGESFAITTVGGTQDSDALSIATLPAVSDRFTIRGSVRFTNTSSKFTGTGSVTLKLYSYDAGTAAYTLRDTFDVEPEIFIATLGTETVTFSRQVTAPDVDGDAGDKFRLEVSANASSSYVTFEAWGAKSPGYSTNGVAWQKASVTEVAATDATKGQYVSFLLMDSDT